MLSAEELKIFTQKACFLGLKEASESVNITYHQAREICLRRNIKYIKKINSKKTKQ